MEKEIFFDKSPSLVLSDLIGIPPARWNDTTVILTTVRKEESPGKVLQPFAVCHSECSVGGMKNINR